MHIRVCVRTYAYTGTLHVSAGLAWPCQQDSSAVGFTACSVWPSRYLHKGRGTHDGRGTTCRRFWETVPEPSRRCKGVITPAATLRCKTGRRRDAYDVAWRRVVCWAPTGAVRLYLCRLAVVLIVCGDPRAMQRLSGRLLEDGECETCAARCMQAAGCRQQAAGCAMQAVVSPCRNGLGSPLPACVGDEEHGLWHVRGRESRERKPESKKGAMRCSLDERGKERPHRQHQQAGAGRRAWRSRSGRHGGAVSYFVNNTQFSAALRRCCVAMC